MNDGRRNEFDGMRVLRRPDVERITGLGRSTLYERAEAGTFPRPINLGGRAVGWIESEVMEWLEARMADRTAA